MPRTREAVTLLLDAGAFVALERNDRPMWRRYRGAVASGLGPITHGGIVGQVWRGGAGRQAPLARALHAVETLPLDDQLGRRAGLLLAVTGLSDAIDAALVALAVDGDVIATSDPDDIAELVHAAGRDIDIVAV